LVACDADDDEISLVFDFDSRKAGQQHFQTEGNVMKVIGCRVAVMSSKTRRTMAKVKKKGSKSYNAWIKPIVEFLLISF